MDKVASDRSADSPLGEIQARGIARLARLTLTDEETRRYAAQLSDILTYARDLQGLDTTGIEPFSYALPISDPMRPDEPVMSMSPEQALSNAPATVHGCFRVPAVLPHEHGE